MHEIEQLRRKLEKHISTHLEIRWKIPALEVSGFYKALNTQIFSSKALFQLGRYSLPSHSSSNWLCLAFQFVNF
jgi:hypothetical protein